MQKIYKMFLICLLLFGMIGCTNQADVNSKMCELLEDNIPEYVIPKAVHDETDIMVFTNYNTTFSWTASDGTRCSVEVILPALTPVAEFAEEYNLTISSYADDLLTYIEDLARNALMSNTTSVSYKAHQNGELISILITERYASGEATYQVATFDLDTQKNLTTSELASRLLNLDYPSFLLVSNEFVRQDFLDRYSETITDEMAEMYNGILTLIPLDTYNLYNRHIFLGDNGKIMLKYQRVLMSEDWWYGLESTECVSEMDMEVLGSNSVAKEIAMNDLLTLDVSDRRYYPEYYSYLLQDVCLSTPDLFVEQLSLLDDYQIERVIGYLNYSVEDRVLAEIYEVYTEILSQEVLSLPEKKTVEKICARVMQ